MFLSVTALPKLVRCGKKYFVAGEEHISRVHPESVLILMQEGELRFSEDGNEIVLRPGEYYIQRAGLVQKGLPCSCPAYLFFEFDGEFSESAQTNAIPVRGSFDAGNVIPLAEKCNSAFWSGKGNIYQQYAYFLRLLGELISPENRIGEASLSAQKLRSYLEINYQNSVTLEEISQKLGYSQSYLIRMFRQEYGVTPHQYVNRLRVERADQLIEKTVMSLSEIAEQVGYTDFSSFYRNYKRAFGYAPSKNAHGKARREKDF